MDTAAATAAATTAKGNGRGRPPVKQAKLDAFVKRSTASPSMAASKTSAPPSSSTTPGSSLPQDYAELLATSSTITSLPPEFRTDDESVRQQKWAALPFNAKKPPPLCPGHGEPCREQTVIKNGPNKGRRFYACARPNVVAGDGGETHGDQRGGGSGDQGNINSGPCKFFQWARDAGTKRKADGDDVG